MLATLFLVLILLLAHATATVRGQGMAAAGRAASLIWIRKLEIGVPPPGRPVSAVVAHCGNPCTMATRIHVRVPP